ncbi:unnamed protein product [Linum trigynum]|uniref:Uncharacterized protein n=1 Tax=Linum trigynum TaxID=586398 RepID=A0AAV2CV08_9ROSI
MQAFPETTNHHLHRLRSDHRPILVDVKSGCPLPNQVRPFRFLAPWISHDDFPNVLDRGWRPQEGYLVSMQGLTEKLKVWNKEVFGNIFQRKKELRSRLSKLEMINYQQPSDITIQEENEVRNLMEETLWEEEVLWIQKSRTKRTVFGDQNYRYFHLSTLSRRQKNRIKCLKDAAGQWISDPTQLQTLARGFYVDLYTEEMHDHDCIKGDFPELELQEMEMLIKELTEEELMRAVKDMAGLKSPGKNGYHAVFF